MLFTATCSDQYHFDGGSATTCVLSYPHTCQPGCYRCAGSSTTANVLHVHCHGCFCYFQTGTSLLPSLTSDSPVMVVSHCRPQWQLGPTSTALPRVSWVHHLHRQRSVQFAVYEASLPVRQMNSFNSLPPGLALPRKTVH